MADFAAVLKNTLDKFGETTPELREKVYEKARQSLQKQIDNLPNTPPQAAIDRQFAKLDAAIAEVEAEHAAPTSVDDDFNALFEEGLNAEADAVTQEAQIEEAVEAPVEDAVEEIADAAEAAVPEVEVEEPAVDEPEPAEIAQADVEGVSEENEPEETILDETAAEETVKIADPVVDEPEVESSIEPSEPQIDVPEEKPADEDDSDPLMDFLQSQADAAGAGVAGAGAALAAGAAEAKSEADEAMDDVLAALNDEPQASADDASISIERDAPSAGAQDYEPRATSGVGKRAGIAAVIALALGGAGFLIYQNQDKIQAMIGGSESETAQSTTTEEGGIPVRSVETTTVTPADGNAQTETANAETAQPETVVVGSGEDNGPKFTQRLTEDGREVDDGPADGTASDVEGSSVSSQTAGTAEPENEGAEEAAPETDTAASTDAAPLRVGQRAIFYEERTGTQAGTAVPGATIWSVVQESPGNGLDPEPAIRGEISIPDLGLTLNMTIRRNGDETLPASHIAELVFNVPSTFDGRGIADVQRVTFKETEQEPGTALIAVPAPIDTNIFLVALTDAQSAVKTNTDLMKDLGWIDIPMQYISGRRALVTIEKGTPGIRVFDEVFSYWDANPLGN